jgi:hypothetical protein
MEINISVYSPTGKIKHNARDENDDDCTEEFLGKINSTKKYSVLLYLSTMAEMTRKVLVL